MVISCGPFRREEGNSDNSLRTPATPALRANPAVHTTARNRNNMKATRMLLDCWLNLKVITSMYVWIH